MTNKKENYNIQQASIYSNPEGKKCIFFNNAYKSDNGSNRNNLSENTVNELNELFKEELKKDNY